MTHDHHDTTMSYLHTATQIHRDTHQRQLHQLALSSDAEDRAFYAERAHRQAEAALRQELTEHDVTKMAMQRLLAQNLGLKRAVAELTERWAPQLQRSAEEIRTEVAELSEAKAYAIESNPDNSAKLQRNVEAMREVARQASGSPFWLGG